MRAKPTDSKTNIDIAKKETKRTLTVIEVSSEYKSDIKILFGSKFTQISKLQ